MHFITDIDLPLANIIGMIFTIMPAAWNDYKKWRIPNQLLLWGSIVALVIAIVPSHGIGLAESLKGAMVGLFMFLPLYIMRGMAAGDVKLLATLGFFAGPIFIAGIGLSSLVIGGIWASIILLTYSNTAQIVKIWLISLFNKNLYSVTNYKLKENYSCTRSGLIPYGVVIAMGCLFMIFINYFKY